LPPLFLYIRLYSLSTGPLTVSDRLAIGPMCTRHLVLRLPPLLLVCLLCACTSKPISQDDLKATNATPTRYEVPEGVAVLAVGVDETLQLDINRNGLAREFAELIRGERGITVFDAGDVQSLLGPSRYQEILRRYEATGRVQGQDVQVLMAAGLRAPMAVITRVVDDSVQFGEAERQPVRNVQGYVHKGREQVVMSARRSTTLSATLIDLRTGSVYWTETFRAQPESTSVQTRYIGKSFTGSVLARMANTMANGVGAMRGPPPPSLQSTVVSLLRKVADSMPI